MPGTRFCLHAKASNSKLRTARHAPGRFRGWQETSRRRTETGFRHQAIYRRLRTLRSHQQLIFDNALKARLKVACGDRLPKGLNRFLLQVTRVEVHEQTSLLNAGGR
jgi:hypothetical protein